MVVIGIYVSCNSYSVYQEHLPVNILYLRYGGRGGF